MYALAEDILSAGASLILESTYTHPDSPGELDKLVGHAGARLSVVYCYATPEVLSQRFNDRANTVRHPGHLDQSTTTPAAFASRGWLDRPDYPGRVISVDTTDWDAVSIPDILEQLV